MIRFFVLREETNARALWAFLKANWRGMAAIGKPLAITVQQHRAKRSDAQNRLYWATLNEIAEHAWINGRQFDVDAWHEHFKRQFIGCNELPDGSMVGMSSTALSIEEFTKYLDRVQQYAAETLGVEIEHQ